MRTIETQNVLCDMATASSAACHAARPRLILRRIDHGTFKQMLRVGRAIVALERVKRDISGAGQKTAWVAAVASLWSVMDSLAGSDIVGRDAIHRVQNELADERLYSELNRVRDMDFDDRPAKAFRKALKTNNSGDAARAALSPRPFEDRAGAFRLLRERFSMTSADINRPWLRPCYGDGDNEPVLPVFLAYEQLSAGDLEQFLDIFAPDLTVVSAARRYWRGTLLEHALRGAMSCDVLRKIDVLLSRAPPALLRQEFTTGLTPVAHAESAIATLRAKRAELKDAPKNTGLGLELWTEVHKMLETHLALTA